MDQGLIGNGKSGARKRQRGQASFPGLDEGPAQGFEAARD